MTFRRHVPILLTLWLFGCAEKESYVVIHTDIHCEVPRVYQLRVTLTNDTIPFQKDLIKEPGPELNFPSTFSLILPESRKGTVDLAIDALDLNYRILGQATSRFEIQVGGRVDVKAIIVKLPVVCGDRVVEGNEGCDDGNRISGDGCNSQCQSEITTPLGDGGVPTMDGGALPTRDGSSQGPTIPYLFPSTGNQFSCAVRNNSTLWCWGDNQHNQLHLTDAATRPTPTSVAGTAYNRVSCGQSHTCALKTDGSLSCFGLNASNQLGGVPIVGDPTWVDLPGTDWIAVSAGQYQTCALKTGGTLWCWGYNTNGQLGIGSTQNTTSPRQVEGIGYSQVSGTFSHACAIKHDGTLYCWGMNSNLQLGIPDVSLAQAPVPVAGTDWISVGTGLTSTCAIKRDHSLWCWGGNTYGQLGTTSLSVGESIKTATPIQVSGGNWESVSVGQSHACAINTEKKLLCWGDNRNGQLSNKDMTFLPTPTPVGDTTQAWSVVAAGVDHTCALDVSGFLYCWGDNSKGQLGSGGTEPRAKPTKVAN